jgi:hypothetical protein
MMTDEELAEAQACVDAWAGKRDADGDLIEGPAWDTEDIVRVLGDALQSIRELTRQRDEARVRLREHEEDNVRLQKEWMHAAAERDELMDANQTQASAFKSRVKDLESELADHLYEVDNARAEGMHEIASILGCAADDGPDDIARQRMRERDDARRAHAYHVALHRIGPAANIAACAEQLYPGQGERLFPSGSYDLAPDGSTILNELKL